VVVGSAYDGGGLVGPDAQHGDRYQDRRKACAKGCGQVIDRDSVQLGVWPRDRPSFCHQASLAERLVVTTTAGLTRKRRRHGRRREAW
jgi:hypothetical protein